MYYYFQSDKNAVLKVDGEFKGNINEPVLFCADKNKSPFIEICAIGVPSETLSFFLDETFIENPPNGISLTDMRGGYFIFYLPICPPKDFKTVFQKKILGAVVTIFNENGLKISIETPNGFYAEALPFYTEEAEIKETRISDKPIILVFFPEARTLNVYSAEKGEKHFSRRADCFGTDDGFYTVEEKKDIAKHKIKIFWELSPAVKEKQREITHSPLFTADTLTDNILPYAFAEEFAVGGNYEKFLSPDLKKNADMLGDFFGNILGVCVPPPFRDYREVGIVKKAGIRKYKIDYYLFERSDGTICGIKQTN